MVIGAKLGTNTNVEAGTKGDEVTAGSGIFKYSPFEKHALYLWRFVYGDTSKASAVADDVTISGITDAVLTEQDVKLTLTGDNFKAIAKDTDVTAWFKNKRNTYGSKVCILVDRNPCRYIENDKLRNDCRLRKCQI